MYVDDGSPYRVRILQRGEDCPVIPLPNKPLQYILLSEGFFCIRLESAVDAPLIAKLEIDGVQARSNFRILPNSTHTIRETRSHMGERSTPLSFTPTSHHTDPSSLDGDKDVDTYCGMIRIFFFAVKDTSLGKWNLGSRDPIAIVMLRYGYSRQIMHLYPTEVRSHLKALRDAHPNARVVQLGVTSSNTITRNAPTANPSKALYRNASAKRAHSATTRTVYQYPPHQQQEHPPHSISVGYSHHYNNEGAEYHDQYEGIPQEARRDGHSQYKDPLTTGTFGPLAMALMAGGDERNDDSRQGTSRRQRGPSPRVTPSVSRRDTRTEQPSRSHLSPARGVRAADPLMEPPQQHQPSDGPYMTTSSRGPGGPGGASSRSRSGPQNRPGWIDSTTPRASVVSVDYTATSYTSRSISYTKSIDHPSRALLEARIQGRPAPPPPPSSPPRQGGGVYAHRLKVDPKDDRIMELEDMLAREQERSSQIQVQCDEWKRRFEDLSNVLSKQTQQVRRMSQESQYSAMPQSIKPSRSPRKRVVEIDNHPIDSQASQPPPVTVRVSPPRPAAGPRRRTTTALPSDGPYWAQGSQQADASVSVPPSQSPVHRHQQQVKDDPLLSHAKAIVEEERRSQVSSHQHSVEPSEVVFNYDDRGSSAAAYQPAHSTSVGTSSSSPVQTPSSAPHSRSHSQTYTPQLSAALAATIPRGGIGVSAPSSMPRQSSSPTTTTTRPQPTPNNRSPSTSSTTSSISSVSSSDSSNWLPPDIDLPDPTEKTRPHQSALPRRRANH